MSRLYEMSLSITGYNQDRIIEIEEAASEEWPFQELDIRPIGGADFLEAYAKGSLGGGETEEQFAHRLARAIFKANGGPCTVEIDATYMENLPCTHFQYGPDHYAQMAEKGEMDTEEGEYFA